MVENHELLRVPDCQHEIDIFSRGGAEKTAKQFDIAYLGNVELDPRFANPAMAALRRTSRRKLTARKIAVHLRPQCGGASRRDQSQQLGERDSDPVVRGTVNLTVSASLLNPY